MFNSTGRTVQRLVCPVMSDSKGKVLCQEANCAAAYAVPVYGNLAWACTFIDGAAPGNPEHIPDRYVDRSTPDHDPDPDTPGHCSEHNQGITAE